MEVHDAGASVSPKPNGGAAGKSQGAGLVKRLFDHAGVLKSRCVERWRSGNLIEPELRPLAFSFRRAAAQEPPVGLQPWRPIDLWLIQLPTKAPTINKGVDSLHAPMSQTILLIWVATNCHLRCWRNSFTLSACPLSCSCWRARRWTLPHRLGCVGPGRASCRSSILPSSLVGVLLVFCGAGAAIIQAGETIAPRGRLLKRCLNVLNAIFWQALLFALTCAIGLLLLSLPRPIAVALVAACVMSTESLTAMPHGGIEA